VQQLPEAFPFEPSAKFLILDHDAQYRTEVPPAIRGMDTAPIPTAIGCPWQNGAAKRWVGSCRRELLDHVIAINPLHLKRLIASYIDSYHQDRRHLRTSKADSRQAHALHKKRERGLVFQYRPSSPSLPTRCVIAFLARYETTRSLPELCES